MLIEIVDDQTPEVTAMLQALYSRSPKSVVEHLGEVLRRGADKFMATFYVGYGHKSIGDCGSTAIFIENVSMLAAKAVQDTPLYNGQEASTRYLDMTKQAVLNPLGTKEGEEIQNKWMALYASALQKLTISLRDRFPKKEDEKEAVWEKAIKAKAFDIARSLLPAGATTYVSWHTNLRQAHDHIKEMRNHPLAEVRDIGRGVEAKLNAKYPASFGHKVYEAEEAYIKQSMDRFAYHFTEVPEFRAVPRFDRGGLLNNLDLLASRPPKAELHQRFRQFGSVTSSFWLDFGSYRDIQRQRSSIQEMPLLTTQKGFHKWYLDQMADMPDIIEGIYEQAVAIDKLKADDVVKQYYIGMGYLVPVVMTCSLPSAVYIAELRSSTTVHPTLRVIAQKMGEALVQYLPELAIHCDNSPDVWNIKRGTQDIVRVESK